jgi:hypothetical protein
MFLQNEEKPIFYSKELFTYFPPFFHTMLTSLDVTKRKG